MEIYAGSSRATARYDLVAQLVEQRPFKAWVLGSNPSGITTMAISELTLKN
jgi:hypothetical protein